MSALYDLRLMFARSVDGFYEVTCALERHDPYPPTPQVQDGHSVILSETVEEVYAAVSLKLPAALIESVLPPPWWDDLLALDDPARLAALAAEWPRERLELGMVEILGKIVSTLPPMWINRLADMPPEGRRMTFELHSETLRRVPWELLVDNELLRIPWKFFHGGEFWSRAVILRRLAARAGEFSPPFDYPLTLVVHKLAEAAHDVPGWSEGLFDGFARYAREMGAIEWQETTGQPAAAEIHHIVYSSSDGPVAEPGIRLATRDSDWVELPGVRRGSSLQRMGQALARYDSIEGRPPRLLVLHDIAATLPMHLSAPLVYLGLEAGADAVLVVSQADTDPAANGFFPMFYRKLLHNMALDQALAVALDTAAYGSGAFAGYAFGARQGGEIQLLLTRPLVETVMEIAEPDSPKVPVIRPPEPASRPERLLESITAQVETVRQQQFQNISTIMGGVPKGILQTEGHEIRALIRGQAAMAEIAQHLSASQQVLESLRGAHRRAGAIAAGVRGAAAEPQPRLTNLWLTDPQRPEAQPLCSDDALSAQAPYRLHLKIGKRVAGALAAEEFPIEALRKVFEQQARVALDVMLFAPESDFSIETPHAQLELPRDYGDSNETQFDIIPQAAGQRRLRVCIYYRNVLLQSLLLEAAVWPPGGRAVDMSAATLRGLFVTRDYIASADLALLDELPPQTLNIFTNAAADGSHWIGLFAAEGGALSSSDMHTFGPTELPDAARRLREQLFTLEKSANFEAAWPLLETEQRGREQDLAALAVEGRILYDKLFFSREDDVALERLRRFQTLLEAPGVISVARCRGESATIPWAALYALPLDTGKRESLAVCPVFKAQIAAGNDLLEQPVACQAQATCPLKERKQRKLTVCPFGFWGILHQIEQPLQQVTPAPLDQLPEELQAPGFAQTSFLTHLASEPLRLALCFYSGPELEAAAHRGELEALQAPVALQLDAEDDRDEVLALLAEGGRQVYYFYCHGELDEQDEFRLLLGAVGAEGTIAAADLDPFEIQWAAQPQPLVILNGCQTLAAAPERIHGFLGKLRRLGAAGVVGTEIEVLTTLARPFGRMVVQGLLEGRSVGEAFLTARRHFMRQYNPLGLAYSLLAPATLHLHDPAGCAWCRENGE